MLILCEGFSHKTIVLEHVHCSEHAACKSQNLSSSARSGQSIYPSQILLGCMQIFLSDLHFRKPTRNTSLYRNEQYISKRKQY